MIEATGIAQRRDEVMKILSDLAKPSEMIEELLFKQASETSDAEAKSAMRAGAAPYLRLKEYYEQLSMMHRHYCNKRKAKAIET